MQRAGTSEHPRYASSVKKAERCVPPPMSSASQPPTAAATPGHGWAKAPLTLLRSSTALCHHEHPYSQCLSSCVAHHTRWSHDSPQEDLR